MKKIISPWLIALVIILTMVPSISPAQTIPPILNPVNDYANIIPPERESKIAAMLVAHREKTGVQIAVLTVGSTGQMSIEEFSLKTAEKWGGGTKERDDGLLLTVAADDRRMRIEVGYGLEGYVTDVKAGRILDGIREDFRNKDYGGGIEKAVGRIIAATAELRPGQEAPASVRVRGAFFNFFPRFHMIYVIMGAAAGFLFIYKKSRQARRVVIGKKTARDRWKKRWHRIKSFLINVLFLLVIVVVMPVLLQMYLPGVGTWAPLLFITGAVAGMGITRVIMTPQRGVSALVIAAIPAVISLAGIIVCFHVLTPPPDMVKSNHGNLLLAILIHTNIAQLIISFLYFGEGSGDDGSWSSSDSSSSDSGGSSWSGGGGDFGGGGASSDW